jgi:hypothetical protein
VSHIITYNYAKSFWKCEFTNGLLQEILQAVGDSEKVVHLYLDCITNLNTFLSQLPEEFLFKCFSKLETLSLRSNYLSDDFIKMFADVSTVKYYQIVHHVRYGYVAIESPIQSPMCPTR